MRKNLISKLWIAFILTCILTNLITNLYVQTEASVPAPTVETVPTPQQPTTEGGSIETPNNGDSSSTLPTPSWEDMGPNPNLPANPTNSATNAPDTTQTNDSNEDKDIPTIIKEAVAKWYYVMRLIVIAFMLLLLIFIGIKMAISTIASEKAVYKQMLVDWVAGMIIVFSIHYIMIFILSVNDSIVNALKPLASEEMDIQEEFEYGDEKNKKTTAEVETTLYESARTRAYDVKLTNGFTGMVIYGVLVYYAWRFALMYFKRMINIMILTLLAPAVSASYAFNKVLTGKAKVFTTWLTEYVMNVITQIVHVIIYSSFVSIVLKLTLESLPGVILAFVLLNFMLKADKILRQLFKLSGGEGSLAGDMQDHSSFKDLKDDVKSFGNAMVGGAATKAAMGLTYRVATKPARAVAQYGFGKAMEHRANSGKYKERQEEKDKQAALDAYDRFTNGEVSPEKWDALQAENAKLKKQQEELKAERGYFWQQEDEKGVQDTLKKLKENQEALEENEKKMEALEKREQELQDEFMKNYKTTGNMRYDLKMGMRRLLDPTKYTIIGKDGKYHRIKTRREGGADWAFWRKKKESIGKTFLNNAKWNNLLGISDAEKKTLEREAKFLNTSILGVIASIVGFPALVVNPMLGMGLLSQAMLSRLDVMTRRRMLKNRPASLNAKYKFKEFGPGAQATMKKEAMNQIKEAENQLAHGNMKKHRKILTQVINATKVIAKPISFAGVVVSGVGLGMPLSQKTYAEMQDENGTTRLTRKRQWVTTFEEEQIETLYQKKLRESFMDTKRQIISEESYELKNDYMKYFKKFEQQVKKDAEDKSKRELLLHDKLLGGNAIAVGSTIMEVGSDDAISKLGEKADEIEAREDISRREKINLIHTQINQNKDALIESSITKLAMQKGITDIEKMDLTSADQVQIKQNIIGLLEQKGIIKKGEIDVNNTRISNSSINAVFNKLTEDSKKTNEKLEEKVVEVSILEYMAQKRNKRSKRFEKGWRKSRIM